MTEEKESALIPTKRTTLLDATTEALRSAILNGEVRPGERVSENAFTSKLEISRSTIREALRQLEQEGMLVRIPFRGTFVREFSEKEIKDLNGLRGVLEAYAAEIIIETGKITAEDLAPLNAIVTQMEGVSTPEGAAQTTDLHMSFHRTLLTMADNEFLFTLWNVLAQQFSMAMRVSVAQGEDAANFAQAHRQVVDALAAGDAERVNQMIRGHIAYPFGS